MNINYIIGIAGAFGVFLLGCVMGINIGPSAAGKPLFDFNPGNLWNFFDAASIFITIGCTLFIVAASFPGSMLKAMPKHFKIILNNKLFDPKGYIEQLVELAQIARKNGLLSLEEKANEQSDPFFKQAIMLIVDANDQDKVRGIYGLKSSEEGAGEASGPQEPPLKTGRGAKGDKTQARGGKAAVASPAPESAPEPESVKMEEEEPAEN